MSKITILLILSIIGVEVGISAFFVFFVTYRNYTAGTWAVISGVFAAICTHLHFLVRRRRLEAYHTQESLSDLSGFGFVAGIISTAIFAWYLFATFYWHIPMMPVSGSTVISAVWAFMTAKWAITLWWFSRKYRIRMELGLPLLEEDHNPLA